MREELSESTVPRVVLRRQPSSSSSRDQLEGISLAERGVRLRECESTRLGFERFDELVWGSLKSSCTPLLAFPTARGLRRIRHRA